MARADLLINLVRAGSRGDKVLFERTVEALAAEERAKQHHILADQLTENLSSNRTQSTSIRDRSDDQTQQLFYEVRPRLSLESLFLPKVVISSCNELIEEHHRRALLQSYGLVLEQGGFDE